MASITIRNLDDKIKKRLRLRAAENGRSMEEEAREILRYCLVQEPRTGADLWNEIRAIVEPLGGIKLAIPPRTEQVRDPPDFSGPEFGTRDDE